MAIALTGNVHWPSDIFHATTVDCYTGERLVVSSNSNVHISHAVSSSMSLPGIFGPTWVGDRVCMDGGMSPSSTHSDLVAGAKRAIIVSLTDGLPGSGPRFSSMPNSIRQEITDLEAAGTKALLISANPGKVNLVSPEEIAPAMKLGYDRGAEAATRSKPSGLSVNANFGLLVRQEPNRDARQDLRQAATFPSPTCAASSSRGRSCWSAPPTRARPTS